MPVIIFALLTITMAGAIVILTEIHQARRRGAPVLTREGRNRLDKLRDRIGLGPTRQRSSVSVPGSSGVIAPALDQASRNSRRAAANLTASGAAISVREPVVKTKPVASEVEIPPAPTLNASKVIDLTKKPSKPVAPLSSDGADEDVADDLERVKAD